MKTSDKSFLVQCACDAVEAGALSINAAALKFGVAPSSVSRALKRRSSKCPTCGHACLAYKNIAKGEK